MTARKKWSMDSAIGRMRLAPLCLLVSLAACSESPDETGTNRRTRIGDTVHVHSSAPVFDEPAQLRKVRQYGRRDGPPETLLADVYAIAVRPDGDVYTFDRGQGIKRWSRDGDLLGTIARSGGGPGEVEHLRGMVVRDDGTLAAYDLGNRKVALFHPDSSVVTYRAPEGHIPKMEDVIQFDRDGELWLRITPTFGEGRGVIRFPRPTFVRLTASGELRDTIFAPARYTEDCPTLSDVEHAAGYWLDKREPWIPKVRWARGPDGTVAFGCTADYSFDVIRSDSVLRISRSWAAVGVDPDEREFFEQYWTEIPKPLPDERPAYARIVLPGDGRTWVWPVQPNERVGLTEQEQRERGGIEQRWVLGRSGAFDVFDRSGRWLGEVELPEEVHFSGYPTEQNLVIRGDSIWAVARDSFDVETVVKYVVEWPG